MKIFRRIGVLIVVIILALACLTTPIFAWTAATTGWYYDFHGAAAEFSMYIANYYENDTSSSIKLGWSYFYIDNWGDDPDGTISHLRNHGFYGNGAEFYFNSSPSIAPGEFAVEYLTMGETTYSKQPMGWVMVENIAWDVNPVWSGMWRMYWWSDLSITTQYQ